MAKCEICGKAISFGKKVSISRSHVSRRANKARKPNIRKVKIVDNGTNKSIHICTRCLRSGKVKRSI